MCYSMLHRWQVPFTVQKKNQILIDLRIFEIFRKRHFIMSNSNQNIWECLMKCSNLNCHCHKRSLIINLRYLFLKYSTKHFHQNVFLQIYKTISRRVRDVYFDGKPITTDNLDRAHILLSDVFVLYGIDLSARLHAKNLNARTFFSKYDANNRL